MRRALIGLALALLVLVVATIGLRAFTALSARGRTFTDPSAIEPKPTAIVFGAGARNGVPSAILRDRVLAAVELYQQGAVQHLLFSGDGRFPNRDEPAAMRRLALRLGVPESAITLDPAGYNTLTTCRRARLNFGVEDAVLVTQAYHLDRALFACERTGIRSVGYVADRQPYRALPWYQLREVGATLSTAISLLHPPPRDAHAMP